MHLGTPDGPRPSDHHVRCRVPRPALSEGRSALTRSHEGASAALLVSAQPSTGRDDRAALDGPSFLIGARATAMTKQVSQCVNVPPEQMADMR